MILEAAPHPLSVDEKKMTDAVYKFVSLCCERLSQDYRVYLPELPESFSEAYTKQWADLKKELEKQAQNKDSADASLSQKGRLAQEALAWLSNSKSNTLKYGMLLAAAEKLNFKEALEPPEGE